LCYRQSVGKLLSSQPSAEERRSEWLRWLTHVRNFYDTYRISPIYFNGGPKDSRPYCDIKLVHHKCKGLLDSGASISAINKDFAESLGDLWKDFRLTEDCVSTATGQRRSVHGIITVPVYFNSEVNEISFYIVADLEQSIILGIDFWNKFKIFPKIEYNCNKPNIHRVSELIRLESRIQLNSEQHVRLKQVVISLRRYHLKRKAWVAQIS
jgi:hypothetical protein